MQLLHLFSSACGFTINMFIGQENTELVGRLLRVGERENDENQIA